MRMKRITEKERLVWCYSFKAGKRWLNAIMVDQSGSRHTEREYSRAIYTFSQWIGKNPDQLIAERLQELKNTETKRNTEDKVREFILWLEKTRNITRTTMATKYHAPLKSFYNYNDLPLKLRTPKHTMRRREPHTTDEVKALMQIADARERAIITVLKDSGISRQDAVKLTYRDIKTEFESEEEFIHLKVVRQKESLEYDTFIGKNAVECLKAYLNYRRNLGEHITDDSPLLASLQGTSISPDGLSQIFVRLSKKVGFDSSPHRFRKFFESHLGLSVPSILVKYWLGHSLGVESHYFLPPIKKQREKYIEAYKEIDIFKAEVNELEIIKRTTLSSLKVVLPPERYAQIEKLVLESKSMQEFEHTMNKFRSGKVELESVDCQRIIEESELSEWLTKGFHFVAVLPSGKVLVSNE
ncbi:tyrosine-type recombinase/integrase [Candidatus Bathyarchaeota archaeon]|nr:tyrosine-type recombinase/integrase [Candidatus Bathyarchaeota archaeon]